MVGQLYRAHPNGGHPIPRLAIIADDLTGALDAAAPFSDIAGGVVVATRPKELARAIATGADVIAVSTRTREADPATARRRVAEVLAALPSGLTIFKKIDSRLKGNIAAELDAFATPQLIVLPAIPEFGRIVKDGMLQGFGVDQPLAVATALGRHAPMARVPDTTDSAQMSAALAAAPAGANLVGARGLALALARAMGITPATPPAALPLPLCFVVGSTDPITLSQVATLRTALPNLPHIAAPSGLAPPTQGRPADLSVLQATPGPEARAPLVAQNFAASAAPILRQVRSMLLTGGATAEVILDAFGIGLLSVKGEVLPGLPYCRAANQVIVTKSGGFGEADTFIRLAQAAANAET